MNIRDKLAAEWAEHGDNKAPSWGAIVILMDDDIRESVHGDIAPCSQKEFWCEYDSRDGKLGDITQW